MKLESLLFFGTPPVHRLLKVSDAVPGLLLSCAVLARVNLMHVRHLSHIPFISFRRAHHNTNAQTADHTSQSALLTGGDGYVRPRLIWPTQLRTLIQQKHLDRKCEKSLKDSGSPEELDMSV